MAHLLRTINPKAAEEADSGWQPGPEPQIEVEKLSSPAPSPDVSDLPSIGVDVVYHVRDGDSRNMRTMFPAVVIDVDEPTRTLSLVIMVDAGDLWRQDRVSKRVPPEAGWDWISLPELVRQADTMGMAMPAPPMPDAIAELKERVTELERVVKVMTSRQKK